jgi:hypothetical protein
MLWYNVRGKGAKMALIECSECKKKISDEAEACVHCGKRLKAKTVFEADVVFEKIEKGIKKVKSLSMARSSDNTNEKKSARGSFSERIGFVSYVMLVISCFLPIAAYRSIFDGSVEFYTVIDFVRAAAKTPNNVPIYLIIVVPFMLAGLVYTLLKIKSDILLAVSTAVLTVMLGSTAVITLAEAMLYHSGVSLSVGALLMIPGLLGITIHFFGSPSSNKSSNIRRASYFIALAIAIIIGLAIFDVSV